MSTINGKGLPNRSTAGSIGDIYIDITTGRRYKCVDSYGISTLGKTQNYYNWKLVGVDKPVQDKAPVKEEKKSQENHKKDEKPVEQQKEEVKVETVKTVEEPKATTSKKESKNNRTNYAAAYESK